MDTQTKQAKYMARFRHKTRSHEPSRRQTEIAPGHAKTKQAAYMVISREKAKQAAYMARLRGKDQAARIKTSKKKGKRAWASHKEGEGEAHSTTFLCPKWA